jgi:hypothetical protein
MNLGKLNRPEENIVNDGENINYGNIKAGFCCTLKMQRVAFDHITSTLTHSIFSVTTTNEKTLVLARHVSF